MHTVTESEARANLQRRADEIAAIQETLLLLSISGMRESIREGLETPFSACETQLAW